MQAEVGCAGVGVAAGVCYNLGALFVLKQFACHTP